MSRYAEAEWQPFPDSGAPFEGPARLVLHTTEGWSIEGAEAAYAAKGVAPHFTVDHATRRWVQHIDTGRSASAMRNESGGVQTNRLGKVVQIEIVGFAAYTQDMADDDLAWLGEIFLTICDREGIDPDRYVPFVGTEAGTIATETAAQRLSFAAWSTFAGVLGHQHVPENVHWDPGRFPYARAIELARKGRTQENDEMSAKAEAQIERIAEALGVADAIPAGLSRNGAERIDKVYKVLGAAREGVSNNIAARVDRIWSEVIGDDVDEAEVAAAVLVGLTPEVIAAAIPADIADRVADVLASRLAD